MAAAQNLEITLDMVVKNQGEIAKLLTQVGALEKDMRKLKEAAAQMQGPMQQFNKDVRGATNPLDAVSKSARQNRQAMQMAGMQIGDFATQISTGSNPVQAFNQQLGQLGYALSTSAKPRLAAVGNFLAGPWSIAVLGATMVLGPMIENLLTSADAAKELEEISDILGQTQNALGDYFDLSTGKIDDNSAATRINTQIKMANLRVTLQQLQADAALFNQLDDVTQYGIVANLTSIFTGFGKATGSIRSDISSTVQEMQGLLETVKLGGEEAEAAGQSYADLLSTIDKLDFEAVGLDSQEFLQSAVKAFEAAGLESLIKDAEKSLETGVLVEGLRKIDDSLKRGAGSAKKAKDELSKYVEGVKNAADPLREIAHLEGLFEQAKNKDLLTTRELAFAQRELNKARAEALVGKGPIQDLSAEITDMRQFGIFPKEGGPGARTAEELQKMKDEQLKAAKEIEERFTSAYEAIGNAVANGFKGMITGAQSFGDAMKRIIQSVIDELFRLYVVQQIVGFVRGALGGILPGASPSGGAMVSGPAAAVGGYPQMNKPVLVGERGPELFVPTGSGKIVANHNLGGGGGGMVINVDARGSSDPEAVRQQVQQGILEAAPSIVAAAQNRTINTLRRPRLAGTL